MVRKPAADDLKLIVEKLDDDLKKLKRLLQALSNESATELPAQPLQGKEKEMAGPLTEVPLDQAQPRDQASMAEAGFSVTAMEPEEFIQKVEKLQRDAETMDRLTRVERQNRRLTLLGALVLAIMLVSIMIIVYLMTHAN